jgi:hypothetical protein
MPNGDKMAPHKQTTPTRGTKMQALKTVKTDVVSKQIAALIHANGSKFFGVTFIKKDGTERTLNGHIRKTGKGGVNTTAHIEKYVTIVLNKKDDKGREQLRNVNMETIKALSIGGRRIKFD